MGHGAVTHDPSIMCNFRYMHNAGLLPEIVEWGNSQCLGRHDVTSWKCHDATACLKPFWRFCNQGWFSLKNSRFTGRCFTGDSQQLF